MHLYETFSDSEHHTTMSTLDDKHAKAEKGLKHKRWAWPVLLAFGLQTLNPLPLLAQQLPALGDGADMSSSAERRIGDRIARAIYRDPDYTDDPVLVDYVQGIWERLREAARTRGEVPAEIEERFSWEIVLDRDRSVNAFALPGGYMGVNLGLISIVSSEDELASVMAHELSHITQRHISRMIGQQSAQGPLMIAAMILGALAMSRNPQAGTAMIAGGQAAAIQGQLNFTRDMEREADRVGYSVLTQAGYAPQGFVTMFEKLQQANRFNDTGAFPYLRSHPLTTERIADMQSRQQLLPKTVPAAMTLAHAMMAARARVLSNTSVERLRATIAESRNSSQGSDAMAIQAGQLYAAALASSRLREFSQAAQYLGKLRTLARDNTVAARPLRLLAAELALAASEGKRAFELLAVNGNVPGNRAELFLWAQALTQSGQAATAAQPLQSWVAIHPSDAQAWLLLAAAFSAQGQRLSAVRAEAESFAAHLDYAAAQNRFKAAQDLARQNGQVDHIEASIIDTRSRQLAALVREQALER
jgi:predicted Zn-dependent protease